MLPIQTTIKKINIKVNTRRDKREAKKILKKLDIKNNIKAQGTPCTLHLLIIFIAE